MSSLESENIIDFDEGYTKIHKFGIEPFINFIETGQLEFFKAKDFISLYDLIFKMCIQRDPFNCSELMYQQYTKSIQSYLQSVAQNFEKNVKTLNNIELLEEWRTRWNKHKLCIKGLSKLFMYLDRFYTSTSNTDNVLNLNEQGFKIYKETI